MKRQLKGLKLITISWLSLKLTKKRLLQAIRSSLRKEKPLMSRLSFLKNESMRLHNQHDKLDESNDSLVDYMWNEYELTYSYALEFKER